MPPVYQSAGSTDDQLSIIDALSALAFPGHEIRPGGDGRWGGPGYHLAVLRETRDFWEDRSEEVVEEAEGDLEADLTVLTGILTRRWGDPKTVDLWPYLGYDNPDPGFAAPEPLNFLSMVASSMRVWRLPSGRWLALAIGQADPEFPFQLLAAIGQALSLPQ